jgi:hypothetical protein
MGKVVGLLPYLYEKRRSEKVAANEQVMGPIRTRLLMDATWRYRDAVERRRRRAFRQSNRQSV